ncbi:30S ribosomal protein S8e [archaeon]|nr:30S ribosomal protein S8e [archaeon]
MLTSSRSKRKVTGGRYRDYRKKKLYEKRNLPALTKLGKKRIRIGRGRGAILKCSLLSVEQANVYNPKTKKYSLAAIKTIIENKANRHYVRRNIMNKGAIIDTEIGRARISSRPGQDGLINAVLIEQN